MTVIQILTRYGLTKPPAGGGGGGISFIGAATGTTSATLPSHQADDVILAVAYRDNSNGAPVLQSGWTDITTAGGSGNSLRIAYRVAVDGTTTSGTWTSSTSTMFLVYRGVNTTAPVGDAVAQTSATARDGIAGMPALTLDTSDGTSWVVAVLGSIVGNRDFTTPPTDLVTRAHVADAADTAVAYDTDGGVTGFAGAEKNIGISSSNYASASLELLAA